MPRRQGELGKFPCLIDFLWDLEGPDIKFYAIVVIHHQYRVVPLTPTLAFSKESDDGDRKIMHPAFLAALVLVICTGHDGTRYVQSRPAISYGHYKLPAITQLPPL